MIYKILAGLFICLVILICSINQIAFASSVSSSSKDSSSEIIEYLRLNVPIKEKEAWILSESESWGPWLEKKDGFLGRQLLWDEHREEAILLISWESRYQWKSIPKEEIDDVQDLFEKLARDKTGKKSGNPFPIKSQGELLPQ